MKTLFAEDAMVAHRRRMAPVYRSQKIRAFISKRAVLIASIVAASGMLAVLFDQLLQILEAMR